MSFSPQSVLRFGIPAGGARRVAGVCLIAGLGLCSAGVITELAATANAATTTYNATVSRADCNSDGTSNNLTAMVTVNDLTLAGKSARFSTSPVIDSAGDTDPWLGNFTVVPGTSQTVALKPVFGGETVYPGTQTNVPTHLTVNGTQFGPVNVTIAACSTASPTATATATASPTPTATTTASPTATATASPTTTNGPTATSSPSATLASTAGGSGSGTGGSTNPAFGTGVDGPTGQSGNLRPTLEAVLLSLGVVSFSVFLKRRSEKLRA